MQYKMRVKSLMVGAIFGVWLSALNGVAAGEAVFLPVKFGLDAMTEDQRKELWENVEIYAQFDAFLTDCGKPSNIESRILAAVQSCVEPRALQKVLSKFRDKKAGYLKGRVAGYCELPRIVALMKDLRAHIESAIQRAASACRSCIIC